MGYYSPPTPARYTGDVLLFGLALRALSVALLTATIILPLADHHAAVRLPESLLQPLSAHDLITHHHPRALRTTTTTPILPSVLPAPSFWAEGGAAPNAATAADLV